MLTKGVFRGSEDKVGRLLETRTASLVPSVTLASRFVLSSSQGSSWSGFFTALIISAAMISLQLASVGSGRLGISESRSQAPGSQPPRPRAKSG